MSSILPFALFLSWLLPPRLLKLTAALAERLQNSCENLFSQESSYRELSQAFICGSSLHDPLSKEIFLETGLIHLMVVSGSHLQTLLWLEQGLLFFWNKKSWLKIFLALSLFFYCLLTGFQPPVLRALASWLCRWLNQFFHWHWDAGKIQLASGVFLLSLFPDWIHSFSFYLSWLSSLGFLAAPLIVKSSHRRKESAFRHWLLTSLCIQALVAFAFWNFSWLGFFMNVLLGPFIGFFLLPLSLLELLLPTFAFFWDQAWFYLLAFLKCLIEIYQNLFPNALLSKPFSDNSFAWMSLWTFLMAIHMFFEILRQLRYRRSYV